MEKFGPKTNGAHCALLGVSMDSADLKHYLNVTNDSSIRTLDQVLALTGWSKEKAVEAHNEAAELLNMLSGLDALRGVWDVRRDVSVMEDMLKETRRDLEEIKSQPYSGAHKELRAQMLSVQKDLAARRKDYENILALVREREALQRFFKAIFLELGETDPVLAQRVRARLVEHASVFETFLDQVGPVVERVQVGD